jgi:two-component system OmpR family response regulator
MKSREGEGEKRLGFVIVEDDPELLDSLLVDLKERGQVAEGAVDIRGLASILGKFTPDVLLVDYYLPGPDGAEIYDELSRNSNMPRTVFVLMSAHPQARVLAEKRGIPYLEKPFTVEEMVGVSRKALEKLKQMPTKRYDLWGELKAMFTEEVV